jgi:uncharacterized membrane protein (UPF0127 family)
VRFSGAAPVSQVELRTADSFVSRLIGLAGRRAPQCDTGLLLTRTRAVHTFGMRIALDLVWLDRTGRVLRIDEATPPRRLAACAKARAVIELAAGGADRAGLAPGAIAPVRLR